MTAPERLRAAPTDRTTADSPATCGTRALICIKPAAFDARPA
jgi:hypothetical protein